MCGIFGWVTPGRSIDKNKGVNSVKMLRHRGPDDEGYLFVDLFRAAVTPANGDDSSVELSHSSWRGLPNSDSADLMLGFRRLSIQDLSSAGHQPMCTKDGKLWIVFNGEVYNFPELRTELEGMGAVFESASDTEVVLAAYEYWGAHCLSRFNGMWGLGVVDLRVLDSPRIFLARDRCGVKPLFYFEHTNGELAFASELKALLPLRSTTGPEEVSLANFLAWGRLPSQRNGDTFARGIKTLPPGCSLTWSPEGAELNRWWDLPPLGTGGSISSSQSVDQLRWLLEDSIRLRLRADVPIGSCLSGGVDSSIIVGLVQKLLPESASANQRTFSAVYNESGPFNEIEHIKIVSNALNLNSSFAVPEVQGLENDFNALVWHQDEPFPTTSMYAQWCLMRKVKESGVSVLLDGQAADELFAGYRPYLPYFHGLFRCGKYREALLACKEIRAATGSSCWKELFLAGLSASAGKGITTSVVSKGYIRSVAKASTFLREPLAGQLLGAISDPSRPESYPWRRFTEPLDDHLRGLVSDFVLPNLLRYEDRNSMAWSIEARVPFTDYRMVEFAFSTAAQSIKINHGWCKWGLRKAGEGSVPQEILWRRDKMGFGTPEKAWVDHLLSCRGKNILKNGSPILDYVKSEEAQDCLKSCQIHPAKGGPALRMIIADQWLRGFGSSLPISV